MLRVDTSDWGKFINATKSRSRALATNPFQGYQREIKNEIIGLLDTALGESEGITLAAQKQYYKERHYGMYGGGAGERDLTKVNPQEKLGATLPGGGLLGKAFVNTASVGEQASFTLMSNAVMKPYDADLPARPAAYYLRYGWKTTKKHMVPRPGFFRRIAISGMKLFARRSAQLLRSVGFKG
jgi:hypothetical protein